MSHVDCSLHVNLQFPPAQCEWQLAIPAHWPEHSPEAQVDSHVALSVQVCVHLEPEQAWVQVAASTQVLWHSAFAWQVWSHSACPLQPSVHLAPVHVALQSLMSPHVFMHCLAMPGGMQLSAHV